MNVEHVCWPKSASRFTGVITLEDQLIVVAKLEVSLLQGPSAFWSHFVHFCRWKTVHFFIFHFLLRLSLLNEFCTQRSTASSSRPYSQDFQGMPTNLSANKLAPYVIDYPHRVVYSQAADLSENCSVVDFGLICMVMTISCALNLPSIARNSWLLLFFVDRSSLRCLLIINIDDYGRPPANRLHA